MVWLRSVRMGYAGNRGGKISYLCIPNKNKIISNRALKFLSLSKLNLHKYKNVITPHPEPLTRTCPTMHG